MTLPGESQEVEFDWRECHVSGSWYEGCEDDGFCHDFECEDIEFGGDSLPAFIQEWICERHYEDLFAKAQEAAGSAE